MSSLVLAQSIILLQFNLRKENDLSIKDTMAGSKRVHFSEIPL